MIENSTQMKPTETPKRRGLQTIAIWLTVSLTLCIATSLVGLIVVDRVTAPWVQEAELRSIRVQGQIERERAVAQARLTGAVAWQWTLNVLRVSLPLASAALLAWIVVRRFSIVHADDAGGYPLFWLPRIEMHVPRRYTDAEGKTRWLPLLAFRARLIDPNRNPAMGVELGREVSFIQAEGVSDPQMQITTQAQVVQAERARASGTVTVAGGGGRGRVGSGSPVVVYPRTLPAPARLPVDSAQMEQVINGEAHIVEAN